MRSSVWGSDGVALGSCPARPHPHAPALTPARAHTRTRTRRCSEKQPSASQEVDSYQKQNFPDLVLDSPPPEL